VTDNREERGETLPKRWVVDEVDCLNCSYVVWVDDEVDEVEDEETRLR
jgi:hypothetical protein